MTNGKIYYMNDNQLIFKTHFQKYNMKFYLRHNYLNVSFSYEQRVIVQNGQIIMVENLTHSMDYGLYIKIPNYNRANSKAYIYPKNETWGKLLLNCNDCINIDECKNESNEVLFYIVKNK